jgi:ABC-2 type transport system ATP-binding protein
MIRLRDLRRSFGPTLAVDGLSLDVHAGEVFGLLGPNGAGKTTTISIATGLLAAHGGEVHIGGEGGGSPRDARVRRLIGVAPQAIALYDTLSARENLAFFASMYGLEGAELAAAIDRALSMVELTDRAHHHVQGYSGGMKRRLNLAAALLHRPRVVFMDEPTAGVDPHSRNAILEMVSRLRSEGTTVVYSTHYMEEAERICDRVAIVDRGRVLAVDTVPALIARHGGASVVELQRAGEADAGGPPTERIETAQPLEVLQRALSGATTGPRITSARVISPSLESVFLALTGRALRD